MRITRGRKFTVKVGDYETYQFEASVSISHEDFGQTDESLARMPERSRETLAKKITSSAGERLNELLAEEVEDAQKLALPSSFVFRFVDVDEPEKPVRSVRKMKRS